MARDFGSQSMVARLRRVLVRRPDAAFAVDDPSPWGYAGVPNLVAAQEEHDAFVGLVASQGAEILRHEAALPGLADSIFVFDPALVTDAGAVILRMGKALRRGEEAAMARALKTLGVPVLFSLRGRATAEGGDLLWVDHDTLAVGQGFRTNAEGFDQLRKGLQEIHVETVPVPLPYLDGPERCLHLLSLVSPVAEDLAVVYPRLLPVPFWKSLKDHGFDFVVVPDEEFPTMAPNVLALAPKDCVMLDDNPVTKARLEEAGCRVRTYRGREISLKAEGGATCLTRPILRRP